MCSDISIDVRGVSKCYHLYDKPRDRLLQMLVGHRKQFYREYWAVRDVSLTVRRGETIGIIGRNGSGKSTLLQMICGTLHPSQGTLTTHGRIAALLELGSGFNPEFTGRENVYMNAAVLGLTREAVDARLQAILDFAGIGEFIDQPVKMYSSGMYVRLAFAVIAHVDADILVVDEALSVGDALFTQKCMRFIRKFREEHVLLFVSHDIAAVMQLCDRVLWLDQGVLRACGPAKTVCEQYLNTVFAAMDQETVPESQVQITAQPVRMPRTGRDVQWRDQRADMINVSAGRNDLEIFRFDPNTETDYGGHEAVISNVYFRDSEGNGLTWIVGGEEVTLRVEVLTRTTLHSPIVGFFVRDRLGQTLFGDNTYFSSALHAQPVAANTTLCAEFEFFMPWLAHGDYVIQVAVAEGTQQSHRQLHWLHDALVFRSHHSPVSTGLIGIPMKDVRLFVDD